MNRQFALIYYHESKTEKAKDIYFLIVPHHVIILLIVINIILIFLEKANHIYVCNHAVLQSFIHHTRDK